MHFRSAVRDSVSASYPMQPYSPDMYSGYAGIFSGNYYADEGGYGWYFNKKDRSITMVFAPGGGASVVYLPTDAKYTAIYNTVIAGKSGMSKAAVRQIAVASGGAETSSGTVSETKKVWEQGWFLPSVAVVTVAAVALIAFLPARGGR